MSTSIFAIPKNLPAPERLERRRMVLRLGLAWLLMMQIMMFAAPGYFKHRYVGTSVQESLDVALVVLNWAGLMLCIPVMLYCAVPIWRGLFFADPGAIHADAAHRSSLINVNLPVALGIVVSFIPSVYTTLYHRGEVYYDSIAMFVAFLLSARYLEYIAVQSSYVTGSHQVIDKIKAYRLDDVRLGDRLSFYFVLIQVVLALGSGLVWYFWIDAEHALPVMVSLFVMSCPCALAMSVPTAYAAARTALIHDGTQRAASSEVTDDILGQTRRLARRCLYASLWWHLLMTPLAMIGLVSPWLAAIIMFVSSLWVALMGWRSYKSYRLQLITAQAAQEPSVAQATSAVQTVQCASAASEPQGAVKS